MKIVPVPTEDYGTFYNGDAYIIYACTEYGKHGGVNMEVNDIYRLLLLIIIKESTLYAMMLIINFN